MKRIKASSKIFLVCAEILLLFFMLGREIHAAEPCYCDSNGSIAIVCYWCTRSCCNCFIVRGGCPGGGCFTADTKIATPSFDDAQDKGGDPSASSGQGNPSINLGQGKEIKDIKVGEKVKSFDLETGEIKEATVTATHKRQVEGYYILKTESGREIKVTGEHPILAVKASKSEARNSKFETISNIKILNSKLRDFFNGVWEKVKNMVP